MNEREFSWSQIGHKIRAQISKIKHPPGIKNPVGSPSSSYRSESVITHRTYLKGAGHVPCGYVDAMFSSSSQTAFSYSLARTDHGLYDGPDGTICSGVVSLFTETTSNFTAVVASLHFKDSLSTLLFPRFPKTTDNYDSTPRSGIRRSLYPETTKDLLRTSSGPSHASIRDLSLKVIAEIAPQGGSGFHSPVGLQLSRY